MAENNKMICLDLETTSNDKKTARIIQISMIKFNPDTFELIDTFNEYVKPTGNYVMSISAISKHHIFPKMLEDKKTFNELSEDILRFIGDTKNISGYNILGFDLKILKEEFNRIGKEFRISDFNVYDFFLEEKRRNGLKLSDTFQRYTGKTMEEYGYIAHNALEDVKATIDIYRFQKSEKDVMPEEILDEAGMIKYEDFFGKIQECFSYGKWANVSLEYVAKYDKEYITWIMNNPGFEQSTKDVVKKYIQ